MRVVDTSVWERWAIVPLCWQAHSGSELDKEKNEYIALCCAMLEDMIKYPRQLVAAIHLPYAQQ